MMSGTKEYSEAKRALLDRYLRGDHPPAASTVTARTLRRSVSTELLDGVVAVHAGGSKQPFFFLHGQWQHGGFYCFNLAEALGSDQPLYAVEPYSFKDDAPPPTFEAMASAHVKSIREIQPEGPFRLGGWCNGGLLAYEMARQLLAEGETVDLLVLMDPVWLVYPRRLRLLRTLISGLGKLTRLAPDRQLDCGLSLRHAYRFPRQLYYYSRYPQYRRSREDWRFGRQDYPGIYDWVAVGYKPTTLYPGKTTFFWTRTQPFRDGWRQLEASGQTEIHILSGRHMTSLSEDLPELAERLRAALDGVT